MPERPKLGREIDDLDFAVNGEEGLAGGGVVVEASDLIAARREHIGQFAIDALGAAAPVVEEANDDGDLLAAAEPLSQVVGVPGDDETRPASGPSAARLRLRAEGQSRSSATSWATRCADMPP